MGNERLTMDSVFMLNYLDGCGAMYPDAPIVSSEECNNVLASIEFSPGPQLNPAGCKTIDECEERYLQACGSEYPEVAYYDNYSVECANLYQSMLNKAEQPPIGYFWSCNEPSRSWCYQRRTDDNPACFEVFGISFLTACVTHPLAVGIGELFSVGNKGKTIDRDPWSRVDVIGDKIY